MLRWVAMVAVVGAAAVGVRWSLRRHDALGRVRAFPSFAVAGLLLVAVGAAVPVIRHDRLEVRLSAAASALVGHRVAVHCQTAGQAFVDAGAELGYVKWDASGRPEPRTTIKMEPCARLRAFHGEAGDLDAVIAVHVLTHEAMHLRGLLNEAEAECAAVQRDLQTATLLGADPAAARALALRYWREVYPRMPEDYRSGQCAPGAPWDERLASAAW